MGNKRRPPTCDARALHAWLKAGRDFSNWIKGRIEKYGFFEDQDFLRADGLSSPDLASAKSRQQKTVEYTITLDMANELSMVENNEQGRKARRYFITCEQLAWDMARRNGGSDLAVMINGFVIRREAEMLSLTDMWRAAGSDKSRQPSEWLSSADGQRFCSTLAEILKPEISRFEDSELVQTTRGGRNPSTFAHWQIALAYAKYLSPEFHMWCTLSTIAKETRLFPLNSTRCIRRCKTDKPIQNPTIFYVNA